jgi:Protein of unknown function (DUF2939)
MRRLIAPAVVLFALAFGVWAYFAPHLTVRSIRLAAEAGDAAALSEHVDFPALRDSVKQQLAQRLGTRLSAIAGNGALGRFGAQIAGALGSNALDQGVDAMVRPEALSALFAGRDLANEYSLLPSADRAADELAEPEIDAEVDTTQTMPAQTSPTQTSPPQNGGIDTAGLRATMGYESLGRFVVTVQEPRTGQDVRLILTRDNLLWWQLSAIELPAL